MPDGVDIDVSGLDDIQLDVEDRIQRLRDPEPFVVGTAVEYAVYLEFGTRDMSAKPFFRPVVNEARIAPESFIRRHTDTSVDRIVTAQELVQTLALAIERRVKEIITKKGLVDTGTLRASIAAVRTEGQLLDAEDADPDATATVEV